MAYRATQTILETGNRGFSLIEILIVIALAAMIATLAIFNIDGLYRAFSSKSAQQIFEDTLQEARIVALQEKKSVFLTLDTDIKKWIVHSSENKILLVSELAYESEDDAPDIYHFLPQVFEKDERLRIKDEPSSTLPFSSAGITAPFAVRFSQNADLIYYDPLTAYPFKSQ